MLDPNATKVTMLFPLVGNDAEPFSEETWSWWLDNIVTFGAYHELATRGTWRGNPERHRCVKIIITDDAELQRLEAFLVEAREVFGQEVMYFEAAQVHFKLI
ncbi:MAG: hypothetical protein QOK37_3268 [Thermoanaerobaculia bacterium]|jgi:hypothetical protein|nr:hypothetical protein [Thermoanaerobaculia bacterium]